MIKILRYFRSKKVVVFSVFAVLLFIFVALSLILSGKERDGNEEVYSPFTEVSKNDNFIGPKAGANNVDRDDVFDALVVDPKNPNVVYLGTENNAVFKSIDGGESWEWLRTGIYHDQRSFPEFYDIKIDPEDSNKVYAATTNGPIFSEIEKSAGFYKSEDGGRSWERFVSGLPNTALISLAILKDKEEKIIFAGLDGTDPSLDSLEGEDIPGGIYQSFDEGKSWEKAIGEDLYPNARYRNLKVRDGDVYASVRRWKEDDEISNKIIKSEDKGKTWIEISPKDANPLSFSVFSDGETIYSIDCGQNIAYKSADDGKNWTSLDRQVCHKIKVSPFDKDKVLFIKSNHISLSEDGLKTSRRVFEDERGFSDIEFTSDEDIIYLAGGGYRVYKSTDGGESFKLMVDLRKFIEEKRED